MSDIEDRCTLSKDTHHCSCWRSGDPCCYCESVILGRISELEAELQEFKDKYDWAVIKLKEAADGSQ